MYVGLTCATKENMVRKDVAVFSFGIGLNLSMIKESWLRNEATVMRCRLDGMGQALHLCIRTNLFVDALLWKSHILSISR